MISPILSLISSIFFAEGYAERPAVGGRRRRTCLARRCDEGHRQTRQLMRWLATLKPRDLPRLALFRASRLPLSQDYPRDCALLCSAYVTLAVNVISCISASH